MMSFFAIILSLVCLLQTVPAAGQTSDARMQKRWLFVWRDMTDPKEVERMLARFPAAHAAGYNGVAFSYNVPENKAAELKQAAKKNGLDLIAIVMGGGHHRQDVEGILSKDALFVAQGKTAVFRSDNPTRLVNADFESWRNNHFNNWGFQDDEGVTTFVDTQIKHDGKASLRMESVGKNAAQHARISQPIMLQPHRQYHASVWMKTENLTPANPEIKVLAADTGQTLSFQTFHIEPTQDWKRYDIAFNSFGATKANLYLGTWYGKTGKMWWDDLKVEEVGLINVIDRPGCPVTVRGENGTVYQEGRDYEKIVDPQFHPYIAYHDAPNIKLTAQTRIKEGERLRVSYYHPIIIYEDRITYCLSEPRVFADWREEVRRANDLLHPAAFFMSHDELRVINQCALCQSKKMTPGELLAENVHHAAQIIRDIRPDAEIWVWNDMFDPMHNAVDNFYAVNGSLKGSWKGLDKGIGIVNWNGEKLGANCKFFADLGLRQILSGYYDGDNDGTAIAKWIANVKGVPSIVGAMYTTWEDRYDAMQTWAQKAWGNR